MNDLQQEKTRRDFRRMEGSDKPGLLKGFRGLFLSTAKAEGIPSGPVARLRVADFTGKQLRAALTETVCGETLIRFL